MNYYSDLIILFQILFFKKKNKAINNIVCGDLCM